ncbi:hypothetical protein LUZ60_000632 [Juncus effusus]|nr:hypothetical protein LUZ60_000632 [Juncus effusus]
METPSLLSIAPFFFLVFPFVSSLHGVAPQDEKYFASAVIQCRDGSGTFTRDRLNDGFCDCPDGTDEPGTSACPEGKFYCKNHGDSPRFLFSSFVNDRICDCCDGSDEYESGINCPNTCKKIEFIPGNEKNNHVSKDLNSDLALPNKHQLDIEMDDLFHKLTGLRIAVILEFGILICIVGFCFFLRRTRTRRRRYSLKY